MHRLVAAAVLSAGLAHTAFAQARDLGTVFPIGEMSFPRSQSTAAMIGQEVVSSDGEKLGEVADVILDERHRLAGYIVDAGGFLGLDATPVFVPADRMTMRIDGVSVEFVLSMDSAAFRADAKLD
jgi:uncharacterized protein YrrD